MHISEYLCKTCLQELGILLKCRETFEKCLAACNSTQNAGLPQIFFTVFWQLYFKNQIINFLTKPKGACYVDFYEFKTKMTGKNKQNHIFQKSKSYEISRTDIYIYIYVYIIYIYMSIYLSIYLSIYPSIKTWLISALKLKVKK